MPNRETRNGHCGQEETKDHDHQIQTDFFSQSVELARRRRLEIYTIHDRGVRFDVGHTQQDCATMVRLLRTREKQLSETERLPQEVMDMLCLVLAKRTFKPSGLS